MKRRCFKLTIQETPFDSLMKGDLFVLLGTDDIYENGHNINIAFSNATTLKSDPGEEPNFSIISDLVTVLPRSILEYIK